VIGALLRLTLPGGVKAWQAGAVALYYNKATIGAGGNEQKLLVEAGAPGDTGVRTVNRADVVNPLLTERQVMEMGQQRARLMPHGPAQWASVASGLAGRAYAPVHQVGDALAVPFRKATLPPITGRDNTPSLRDLIADGVAGARVPVQSAFPPPWQPNPVIGWIAAAGAAALAKFWPGANAGRGMRPASFDRDLVTDVTLPKAANVTVRTRALKTTVKYPCSGIGGVDATFVDTGSGPYSESGVVGITVTPASLSSSWSCGATGNGPNLKFEVLLRRADGTTAVHSASDSNESGFRDGTSGSYDVQVGLAMVLADGVPVVPQVPRTTGPVKPFPVQPAAVPVLPGRAPVVPASPAQVPGTSPTPSTAPDPDVQQPSRPSIAPPATVPGGLPNGTPVIPGVGVGQPVLQPVPTTPVDSIIPWPGSQPIGSPGQQPQPNLTGIAQELGRIERKLEIMNTPPRVEGNNPILEDLPFWARLIWELMTSGYGEGKYQLWSPCVPPDDPGGSKDPLQSGWPAGFGQIAELSAKLDSLAGLLQDHKVLPQPTCRKPVIEGEWVSVNFESDEVSPGGEKRLRKLFRYRDQNNAPLVDHVDHWRDFTWQAGGVVVVHKGGTWGVPQVWASTADEGKRVIGHAAQIAGVDLDAPGSSWVVTHSDSPRYGRPGTMRVRRGTNRIWMVSKRPGPSGPAEYLAPA
jgi:hypothetical protein